MIAKWMALFIFCHFTLNNGFAWLIFDPVATELPKTFYRVSPKAVELLSSWQPLVYVVAFYPLTRLQSKADGLRRAVVLGAIFEVVGSGLKVSATLAPHSYLAEYLLHLGQICSGVASPVAIGAPAMLSAQWFPPHLRTRTTAAAVLSNNIGNAIAYGLIPLVTKKLGFRYVLYLECASACVLFLCLVFYPSPPGVKKRHAGNEQESNTLKSDGVDMDDEQQQMDQSGIGNQSFTVTTMSQHVKNLFGIQSAIILCISYSWSSGSYVAWTSLYEELIGGSIQLTPAFVGLVSLTSMLGYVTGGISISWLTDLFWKQSMKKVLIVSCLGCSVCAAVFLVNVRDARETCIEIPEQLVINCPDATPDRKFAIVLFGVLTGFGAGAAAPIFYELMAEVSYPIPEVISGNVLSLCEGK